MTWDHARLPAVICLLDSADYEPSRALDALIFVASHPGWLCAKVGLGYVVYKDQGDHVKNHNIAQSGFITRDRRPPPNYTCSVDAVLGLIPRSEDNPGWFGWDFELGHTNGGMTISARVGETDPVFGNDLPHALLRAIVLHVKKNNL